MNSFVETALRSFFGSRPDLFEEQNEYSDFLLEEKYSGVGGLKSTIIFGRISYRYQGTKNLLSDSLAIKQMVPKLQYISSTEIFEFTNECFFYTEMLPFLNQFCPMKFLFPRYFQSDLRIHSTKKEGLIIMENLQACGFILAEKHSFLDYNHLSLMLRKLGNFHAGSYKAKNKDPTRFRTLCNSFSDTIMPIFGKYNHYLTETAKYRLQCLKNCSQYSEKLKKVEKLLSSMPEVVEKIFNADKNNRITVLCHGDYCRGNAMFKYERGKPVDLKIIDMVTCRLASPIMDLAKILYLNADQPMRDEHWDDLIDNYYAGLREPFGDVEIPTKDEILAEFRHKSFFPYICAAHFLNYTVAHDNGLQTPYDFLPSKFKSLAFENIPQDVLVSSVKAVGEDLIAKATSNVLKDMMDRGFL